MTATSLMTNPFLKLDNSISIFLISIIGPRTKNPIIEPIENWFIKVLALKPLNHLRQLANEVIH